MNHDTLLVVGWLDLSSRPQVLHVPDFSGRYYSVQFTDPFNIDFGRMSARARQAHRLATISLQWARLERTAAKWYEAGIFTEQFGARCWSDSRLQR